MTAPLRIPLSDFRASPADIAAVTRTLESGWVTAGPQSRALEETIAARLGAAHAALVSSCTAGLHLAMLAADIGAGDEVIIPAITFVATASAVHFAGATPVLADVKGKHDLGIDVDDVARRITPRTRAICAMHYAGYSVDMSALRRLCDEHDLLLIEDAAHHPTAPMLGDITCLSFFTNKVLACGEGGLFATNDGQIAERARSLLSHGVTRSTWARHQSANVEYDIAEFGLNYRFDDLRASLLASRLSQLDGEIQSRRGLVHRYRERLKKVSAAIVPYRDGDVERSSCYVMPILLEDGIDRDQVRRSMREVHGIQTSVLYPALHQLRAWPAALGKKGLANAEFVARHQLTLPLYGHLAPDQVDEVVDTLHLVAS